MLREQVNVNSRPLSAIFERPWEVPEDWKRANITPVFKEENLENYRLASLTLMPKKVMQQIILKTTAKYLKYKTKTVSHQHGFMKGKTSYLTNKTTSCDEIIGLLDEGKAADIVYHCFL